MHVINQPADSAMAASPWQVPSEEAAHCETAQVLSRLDFRHLSNHISQKRPGYYLILLRNELRHRSLRDKPALAE